MEEIKGAIIANMCDGCDNVVKGKLFDTCLIHKNPTDLPCVENNEPCGDYKEVSNG